MSLTKLAPKGWGYFAQEIATGREDYYAASAEGPGRYLGRGAEAIGLLATAVDAAGLERLIGSGADPRDGRPLGRPYPEGDRVVAGYALTFSPPKSVSVLWGTGGEAVAEAVLTAHERAVEVALSFLERHAAFTRLGAGGVLQADTEGLLGAVFVHRTSRAADPQLHTHVLVANKVRATDGKWRSLDGRELYAHQKATGVLYKSALRAELTAALAVSWTTVDDNGIAEIEGIPELLAEAWSSRRRAVESVGGELVAAKEAHLGRPLNPGERARAFQLAAYRTRAPKIDADTPTAELTARWRAEAASWGHPPEAWLAKVLNRAPKFVPEGPEAVLSAAIARLEQQQATWSRAEVVEVLATLVSGTDGEQVLRSVEELTDRLVGDHRVCSLAAPLAAVPPPSLLRRDGMTMIERHGAARYTTKETLQREARILEIVAAGITARAAVVPQPLAEEVLARSSLGTDQQRAVRALLRGGEQVALLVGPAGAGKSRALGAAREAWTQAGYRPFGLAPSAMAAGVLDLEAGLPSETLARFLLDLEAGRRRFTARDVIVLDEAAMARTDDLERLLSQAAVTGAKVVLVGDPAQLGAVGPGGMFATLVGDHGANELETVRRFAHVWEGEASLRLRARDTSVLLEYDERGRIAGGSREEMEQAAFTAWRVAREEGRSVLLMAGDNATAEALSARCRAERVRQGEVERHGVSLAKGVAGVGDEIVTLRNDRNLQPQPGDFVRNGDRWSVLARDERGGLTVSSMASHGELRLPPFYVREHVALGYALTIHKAQGTTVDAGIVLVDEQMTSQQLYVAMSRGREANRAFVARSLDPLADHSWPRPTPRSALEELAEVMRRDGAERSAHDVLRENLERSEDETLLGHLFEEAKQRIDEVAGPDRRRQIALLEQRAAELPVLQRAADAAARELETATRRREQADAALAKASELPLRVALPGLLSTRARADAERRARAAAAQLDLDGRSEGGALRSYDTARRTLERAEQARRLLEEAQSSQEQRMQWLRSNPEEVLWALSLQRRLQTRRPELEQGGQDESATAALPTRAPKARVIADVRPEELDPHELAIEVGRHQGPTLRP